VTLISAPEPAPYELGLISILLDGLPEGLGLLARCGGAGR